MRRELCALRAHDEDHQYSTKFYMGNPGKQKNQNPMMTETLKSKGKKVAKTQQLPLWSKHQTSYFMIILPTTVHTRMCKSYIKEKTENEKYITNCHNPNDSCHSESNKLPCAVVAHTPNITEGSKQYEWMVKRR